MKNPGSETRSLYNWSPHLYFVMWNKAWNAVKSQLSHLSNEDSNGTSLIQALVDKWVNIWKTLPRCKHRCPQWVSSSVVFHISFQLPQTGSKRSVGKWNLKVSLCHCIFFLNLCIFFFKMCDLLEGSGDPRVSECISTVIQNHCHPVTLLPFSSIYRKIPFPAIQEPSHLDIIQFYMAYSLEIASQSGAWESVSSKILLWIPTQIQPGRTNSATTTTKIQ